MESEFEAATTEVAQLQDNLCAAQRMARRHARLNEIACMFTPDSQENDLEHWLRECLDAAGADGGFAAIRDLDTDKKSIIAVGMSGSHRSLAAIAAAAMAGEPLLFGSIRKAGERFPALLDEPLSRTSAALACIPLVASGRSFGALALSYPTPQPFAADDLAYLRTLAGLFANGVSLASRFVALRRTAARNALAARRAKGLSDAARFMTGPDRPVEEILANLVHVACDCLADGCIIRTATADGKSLEIRAVHHNVPSAQELIQRTMMQAVPFDSGEVLRSGRPVLVSNPNPATLARSYPSAVAFIQSFPVSSFMHVPLRAHGHVFGIVSVTRHEGGGSGVFEEEDLRFLEDLADRAALSLEKARLRDQLQLSERQLRVALDAAHLGAWEWDIVAQRVSWSPTLEQIHGIPVGSFTGTFEAYQQDIHPEDRDRVVEAITMIVEQHTDHHIFYRIIRPDGEVRWVEAHGKLLFDANGRPERLIGVCSDVTERRRSEERLRETLLALQDSDQRKDQFLSMLAHELRNPLGPMLNATHLLQTPGLSSELADRARQILERQVHHMSRLLDDLLDVSRISRGKIELRREHVDLVALVHEVLADQGEAIRIAGLRCVVADPREQIRVHGDRTRIGQVIANTISNAIKFSDTGTIHVGLTRDRARETVLLSIRDEGIGVESSVLQRIFEPFVQADSLRYLEGAVGSAWGSRWSKGWSSFTAAVSPPIPMAEMAGTEVRIELPLDQSSIPPVEVHPVAAQATEAIRVLVFEDNIDAAESLRVILSEAGHWVGVESTGSRALEVIRAFRPDVVLCDLGLPEKDGYAIAAEVRSDKTLLGVLMIAISGYGATEDQIRSKRAGFDVHLTKPVPPLLVLSEISKSRHAAA